MEPFSAAASALTMIAALNLCVETISMVLEAPRELQGISSDLKDLYKLANTLHMLTDGHSLGIDVDEIFARPCSRLVSVQAMFDGNFTSGSKRKSRCAILERTKRVYKRKRLNTIAKEIGLIRFELLAALGMLNAVNSLETTCGLERSASFFPPKYAINSQLKEPLMVVSWRQLHCSPTQRIDKIFLLIIEDTCRWKRLTVVATTIFRDRPWEAQLRDSTKPGLMWVVLPGQIEINLLVLLRGKNLGEHATITRIAIELDQDHDGNITFDPQRRTTDEDVEEINNENSTDTLLEIKQRGLPTFIESEITVIKRIKTILWLIGLRDRMFIMRKSTFAGAAGAGRDLNEEFLADLKLLLATQQCTSIARFAGVVMDREHKTLCGYLLEVPVQGELKQIVAKANRADEVICWSRRSRWIRQAVQGVADAHLRGCPVGVLNLNTVWLDRDDNIVMLSFSQGGTHFGRPGFAPPEFRAAHKPGMKATTPHFCSPTLRRDASSKPMVEACAFSDIFQLGMFMWLLSEHIADPTGQLCPRYGCKIRPRYTCRAPHSDPIELPPCNNKVPSYINEMISRCRKQSPQDRTSATQLLELLPSQQQLCPRPPRSNNNPQELFQDEYTCNECWKLVDVCDAIYHCNICEDNDFDLCPTYYCTDNIRCYDPSHLFEKRICKDERWINVGLQ